jgi:hypothetical protein
MELLSLALESRVPFVLVKTEDMVYAVEVLSYVAKSDVKRYMTQTTPTTGEVYYAGEELPPTTELWLTFKKYAATLVFVNTKRSALHVDCGPLFPPKELVRNHLIQWVSSEKADAVLPSFGGLTLKEVFEVRAMANKTGDKDLTPVNVNSVRRQLLNRNKGISQIDSTSQFYEPPTQLAEWVGKNKKFLLSPPHPKLMPRGLLFGGPPGTGKTAGAKYLAHELGLPLFHVDIGAMKGKYVGDSEGALHTALTQLDQASPCVALIDEVEKTFTNQADQGTTTSMLGTLLWWLQEHKSQVFTIMTTNAQDKLPPELFREGRVDATMMFMGLSSVKDATEFCSTLCEKLMSQVGLQAVASDWGLLEQELVCCTFPLPQVKAEAIVTEFVKTRLSTKEAL